MKDNRWRHYRRHVLGGAFGNLNPDVQDEMRNDLVRHPKVKRSPAATTTRGHSTMKHPARGGRS